MYFISSGLCARRSTDRGKNTFNCRLAVCVCVALFPAAAEVDSTSKGNITHVHYFDGGPPHYLDLIAATQQSVKSIAAVMLGALNFQSGRRDEETKK